MLQPRYLRSALLAAVLLCGPAAADELAGAPAIPVASETPTDVAADVAAGVAPDAVEPFVPAIKTSPLSSPRGLDAPAFSAPAGAGMGDFVWSFVRSMLMLGVVLALVYLVLHKGVGKLVRKTQAGRRMQVVDRIVLEQRRTLFIVDVDGEEMLLAATDGSITRLDRMGTPAEPEEAPRFTTENHSPRQPPLTGVLRQDLDEGQDVRAEGKVC